MKGNEEEFRACIWHILLLTRQDPEDTLAASLTPVLEIRAMLFNNFSAWAPTENITLLILHTLASSSLFAKS